MIGGYFPEGQLTKEKEVLQKILRTGVLEFISDTEQYDYATNRNAALFVMTNYEQIAQEWAERVLSWFDKALGYEASVQTEAAEEADNCDYQSPIDAILDQNNTENIVMYNENNEKVEFEQIALIPMDGIIYVILRPVEKMMGIASDEALAFMIEELEGEPGLALVSDYEVVEKVFEAYYQLLDEVDTGEN